MRPQLSAESVTYKIDYAKAIIRLGEIFSKIMTMKNPKPIYDYILESISELFYLTEMALKLNMEGSLKIAYYSVFGYETNITLKMLEHEYPEDWMKNEIKEDYRVSKNGYLVDGVEYSKFLMKNPGYDVLEMYDRPEMLIKEREHPEQWHEADFFNFVIYDDKGNVVGYLEVNDNAIDPEYLPPLNIIEGVDAFSQIIGVIYRISLQVESDKRKQEFSDIISSILAKELIPHLSNSAESIRRIKRLQDIEHNKSTILKSSQLIKQTISYLDSITSIIEIENRKRSVFTMNSLERLFNQWKTEAIVRRKNFKAESNFGIESVFIKVDNRFSEMIFSIINLFDIAMEKDVNHVEIIKMKSEKNNIIKIGISSQDVDDKGWRIISGHLISIKKTRSSYSGGYLSAYIINSIIRDYAGDIKIELKDRKRWIILNFPKI